MCDQSTSKVSAPCGKSPAQKSNWSNRSSSTCTGMGRAYHAKRLARVQFWTDRLFKPCCKASTLARLEACSQPCKSANGLLPTRTSLKPAAKKGWPALTIKPSKAALNSACTHTTIFTMMACSFAWALEAPRAKARPANGAKATHAGAVQWGKLLPPPAISAITTQGR